MGELTADVLKLMQEVVEQVRGKRDIYASFFISTEGVSIEIYPFKVKKFEEEK